MLQEIDTVLPNKVRRTVSDGEDCLTLLPSWVSQGNEKSLAPKHHGFSRRLCETHTETTQPCNDFLLAAGTFQPPQLLKHICHTRAQEDVDFQAFP